MKKYLMMGAAALTMGFAFVSCSSDDVVYNPDAAQDQAIANYKKAFIEAFGQPDAKQDWGFGTSSRATRGADKNMPTNPTFSDDLSKAITVVQMPDFPDELPSTGVTYAGNIGSNDWKDGMTVYLDKNHTSVDQNKSNLIIYINDDLTFDGTINNGGNGYTFIVLKDKKLTLKTSCGQNMKIYLAPKATLDMKNASIQEFNQPKAGLYMKAGSKVEASTLNFFQGWKVLNQGGTIECTNLYAQKEGTVIWNAGTITVTGALATQNEKAKIYNATGCKITANTLTLNNNNELFYNDGEVEITGAISQGNNGGEIINNGSLKAGSIYLKASGKMHNVGTTEVSGKTTIDNTGTKWKNEGEYTTGDFEIKAYAEEVFNNCKLTVHKADGTGEFKIYGKFVLEGGDPNDDTKSGASVVTDKLDWVNNSFMFLGTKSMLLVQGVFLTENKDSNGALVGPTTGHAVVKAESIVRPSDLAKKQFGMTYLNNLFVDAGSHFEQGAEDPANNPPAQPYYKYDNTVTFKHLGATSPVSIPRTTCNPGYNNGGGITYQGRIMAEDLTVAEESDLDFNDVVFCWAIKDNKAYIKLEAAGGTLPLYIGGAPNEGKTEIIGGKEVHTDLFKVPVSTMVNTGLTVKEPVEFTLDDKEYTSASDIRIFVKKGDKYIEMLAPEGEPTSKINVPVTTKWVDEYVNISNAYTWFSNWVKDKNTTTSWNNPVERFVDYILSNNAITVTE